MKTKSFVALVATILLIAGAASAQTGGEQTRLATRDLRLSTPGVREALATPHAQFLIAQKWNGSSTPRLHRTARKAAWGILGGVGGFFAGGLIGAAVEPDCHCDDPGLKGFIIGAPIGAALGAMAGVVLASR
jgi:hypothetical protein